MGFPDETCNKQVFYFLGNDFILLRAERPSPLMHLLVHVVHAQLVLDNVVVDAGHIFMSPGEYILVLY